MRPLVAVILLYVISAGAGPQALEIEKFLMPGEVISGHAKFEFECTQCHVRLRATTQKKLCLDCHELVAGDIANERGYHGKDPNAAGQGCKSCHGDHLGRGADIVSLDSDTFDHRLTDYPLSGQHATAECSACHQPGQKYREAPRACHSCHARDDAHAGRLGKKCIQCHATSGWSKTGFEHDKTGFKLEYSHAVVSCSSCHVDAHYKNTPRQCAACHAIKDVHENRFGKDCQQCHTEKQWNRPVFDHNSDTGFELRGLHLKASCNACHAPGYHASNQRQKTRSCYSCHRSEDVHNGANGNQCEDCHGDRGWNLSSFDHDTKTSFPLLGGHTELACGACHLDGAESAKIATDCYSCHRQDDVHQSQLGNDCGRCHNSGAWQRGIRFDHDLSSFPLIGQHAVLGCEACHASSKFNGAGKECIDCHGADDVHRQVLGEDCRSCHNPAAWLIWDFNHDATDFPLRHAHAEIHCHGCHRVPLDEFGGGGRRCIDCHRRDDAHAGKFGGQCDKCHNEKSFQSLQINSVGTFQSRPGPDGGKKP